MAHGVQEVASCGWSGTTSTLVCRTVQSGRRIAGGDPPMTHSDEGTLLPDEALDRLGSIRLTDHSMRSLLGEIASLAQQSLPGRLEASVTLLTGDDPVTAVTTGQLAQDLDQAQYAYGHGPCLNAATVGEPTEIEDARADPR